MLAIDKHIAHVRHVLRVKMRHVNGTKFSTVGEHLAHICHILRIQVVQMRNAFKFTETVEHFLGARRLVTLDRFIKHDFSRGGLPTAQERVGSAAVVLLIVVIDGQGLSVA